MTGKRFSFMGDVVFRGGGGVFLVGRGEDEEEKVVVICEGEDAEEAAEVVEAIVIARYWLLARDELCRDRIRPRANARSDRPR